MCSSLHGWLLFGLSFMRFQTLLQNSADQQRQRDGEDRRCAEWITGRQGTRAGGLGWNRKNMSKFARSWNFFNFEAVF